MPTAQLYKVAFAILWRFSGQGTNRQAYRKPLTSCELNQHLPETPALTYSVNKRPAKDFATPLMHKRGNDLQYLKVPRMLKGRVQFHFLGISKGHLNQCFPTPVLEDPHRAHKNVDCLVGSWELVKTCTGWGPEDRIGSHWLKTTSGGAAFCTGWTRNWHFPFI